MPTFKVAVEWAVYSEVEVEAETLEEAINLAESPDFPLPLNPEYVDGSFNVNLEVTEFINEPNS